MANTFHRYNAKVTRILDGDTLDVTVDLGFHLHMDIRFRLLGFDAPETWRPKNEEEARLGKLATDYLKSLIDQKDVIIESNKFGKYRYLAKVYLNNDDKISVNQMMIHAGHIK